MPKSDTSNNLIFETPGPGTWVLDSVHYPRPLSRYFQETHPSSFKKGTNDFAHHYGLLTDGLLINYVNGFGYTQVLPAPENEIPTRIERAELVFKQKFCREQLRDWDERCKPATIAIHRELQAINPDTLSDAELIAYLKRCRDHHANMLAQHMRFTAGAILPTGDFLAHVTGWTNLSPAELLGLMRGASTISSGGSEEMVGLKLAFAKDQAARNILISEGDPKEIFTKLCSLKGEVGVAMRNYLDLVGNRLLDGFDITEPTAIEMPDALLRSIRITLTEEAKASPDVNILIAKVRAQVPAAHQSEFDELLEEARHTYRMRDERGIYSDIWASGIMRRAALSAGRRVASRGRLSTPQQMLDATLDEMCALVADKGGPSADELAKRAEYRANHSAKEAPALLGSPNPPTPDLNALPAGAARVMRALFISLGEIFESAVPTQHEEMRLVGLAACKGVYEGPARRVSSPAEFDRITKGDVLITESTSEAFNILLPLLGGIVTDNGGLLSHAAIVSREYGIPGVVGTRDATKRISDGVRVRVDGDKGEVTVLE
jgi:pyruvate,water dikinase